MRKLILLVTVCILALSPVYGQKKSQKDRAAMRKEMLEFKIKYLSQEMDLSKEQQEKFTELYRQMNEEKRVLFRATRAAEKKVSNAANATDADYEAAASAMTQMKEKDAEIDKKYDKKFATFLSSKQIFKMKAGEDKFRQRMHKMRKQRKNKK